MQCSRLSPRSFFRAAKPHFHRHSSGLAPLACFHRLPIAWISRSTVENFNASRDGNSAQTHFSPCRASRPVLRCILAPKSSANYVPQRPAAPARATVARYAPDFDVITVFHRQLFSGPYLPAAVKVQAAPHAAPHQIRSARVVDKLRAASTSATVQEPPRTHARDIIVLGRLNLCRLQWVHPHSGVFDHAAAAGNVLERKYPVTVQRRAPHPQTKPRCFRVDLAHRRARHPYLTITRSVPRHPRAPQWHGMRSSLIG
jgi:hypothetical protein